MTDPAPATPVALPTISIDPSATRALLLMLVRVAMILATAMTTLLGLIHKHDVDGFIAWVQSDNFVVVLSAIGSVATIAYSGWITLSKKWREVYLGHHVDDKIAVVGKAVLPPSVEDVMPGKP